MSAAGVRVFVDKAGTVAIFVQLPQRFAGRWLDEDVAARAAAVAAKEINMLVPAQ
jgi:hypothetical protein